MRILGLTCTRVDSGDDLDFTEGKFYPSHDGHLGPFIYNDGNMPLYFFAEEAPEAIFPYGSEFELVEAVENGEEES